MAPPPDQEITLTDYNDDTKSRIRSLERGMSQLLAAMQPTLVKLEGAVTDLGEKFDTLCSDVKDLKEAGADARVEEVRREGRLTALEEELKERRASQGRLVKWAGGIAATVIGAMLLAYLGFGSKAPRRYEAPAYTAPSYDVPAPK